MSSGYDCLRRSRAGVLVPEAAAALLGRVSIFAKPALLCPHAQKEREREDNVPSHPPTLNTLYLSLVCLLQHTVYGEKEKGKGKKNMTSLAAVCAEKMGHATMNHNDDQQRRLRQIKIHIRCRLNIITALVSLGSTPG